MSYFRSFRCFFSFVVVAFCVFMVSSNSSSIALSRCGPTPSPKSGYECLKRKSECWSVGVRDLDCQNSGYCCFDGCANVCLKEAEKKNEENKVYETSFMEKVLHHQTSYAGNEQQLNKFHTKKVAAPRPYTSTQHATAEHKTHQYDVERRKTSSVNKLYSVKPILVKTVIHSPYNGVETGKCPRTNTISISSYECKLLTKDAIKCWSPGQLDTDCPSHGLCCFDGCQNSCVSKTPEVYAEPTKAPLQHDNYYEKPIPKPIVLRSPPKVPVALYELPSKYEVVKYEEKEYNVKKNDHQYIHHHENEHVVAKVNYDLCHSSPCGPGAICKVNSLYVVECSCEEGLYPIMDKGKGSASSILGCSKRECHSDYDCLGDENQICDKHNYRCVNPCDHLHCGYGAKCESGGEIGSRSRYEQAKCVCQTHLMIPVKNNDATHGCRFQCKTDYDCNSGYECSPRKRRCVKSDPCEPNPCGMMANCHSSHHITGHATSYLCKCQSGSFGNPYAGCVQGECENDVDCAYEKKCHDNYCVNPCFVANLCDSLGENSVCEVKNHVAMCGQISVAIEPKTIYAGQHHHHHPHYYYASSTS